MLQSLGTTTRHTVRSINTMSRMIWVALVINSIAAFTAFSLPLFNLLDYESGLALALVHSFTTLPLLCRMTQRGLARMEDPRTLWVNSVIFSLLMVIPTFLIMMLSGLVNGQCGWLEGMRFFFYYVVLSSLVSAMLGFTVGRVVSGVKGLLLAFLLPLFSIGIVLYRLYQAPPIFAYDPFFGFFSGAMYDRLVEITPTFSFARVMHLLWALGLSLVVMGIKGDLRDDPWVKRGGGAVLLLGALLWLLGPTMGFRHTRASIRERLGGQIITPHFIINHGSSINPDTLKLFSAQAEFHHEELTRWFHGAPRGRLTIWLFADSSQKRRLFGAENVEVAKTWLKEIYVTASMFPHHSLKHELAHIFAGIYGDSFFKASMSPLPLVGGLTLPWPNPGIIEGMAVAADFNKRDTTFHEKAKILYMFHLAAPMETVFSSAFYSLPASRAYTQAGSFVRFLYDTHGARKVFQLYREGGGWQRIFGKSLKALEQDYSDFIKTVTVDENMVTMTRALFSRRPLHRVRCAHQVAREIRRAQNQMARRSFSSALLTLERAMDYDPGSLDLKMFYLMAAREAKSFEKAEDAACTILAKASKNPLMQAQSQLVLAQMELTRDNPKKANSYLLKVEKLPMTRGTHREVTLMKVLIRCDKPLRDKLRAVIFSNLPYPKALADLTALGMRFPLAHYLAGSLALMSGRYAQSVEAFGRITPEALPDDEFRCAYYHRMTKAAVLARDQVTRDRWISELQNCPGGKISARFLGDFSRFIERTPCLPLWSVNAPIPR